ncbi:hypothetical protein VM98_27745, partial [Streptomyces rubellomurinus subsp. indigoferus]
TGTTTTTPASTTGSSAQYDAAGNTTTVTDTSGTATLTWNSENKLASYTKTGTAGPTTYLYDATGNQLIRRDPGKTTITLGNDELIYDSTANKVTGVRYYQIPGGTTLVRQGGKSTYQIADHHGTGNLAIDGTTLTESRRPADPFGNPRGTQPTTWAGDHGYVGGTKDDATGLTNLGAREYQPTTGRFLNPDPIVDLASPQQWNAYAYSNNNPVNLSDPSGLHFEECSNGMYVCSGGITPTEKGRDYDRIVEENKKAEQFELYSYGVYWKTHKTVQEQYAVKCSRGRCNPNSKEGHEGNNADFLFGLGTIAVLPLDVTHSIIHLGDHSDNKPGPMDTYIDWAQRHGADAGSAEFASGTFALAAVGDAYAANPGTADGLSRSGGSGTVGELGDWAGRPDGQRVFAGHGGWWPWYGWTRIPKGSSLATYGKKWHTISDFTGFSVEIGDTALLPVNVYGPGKWVRNLRLFPPDENINVRQGSHTVTKPTPLSDLMEPDMGPCHWAACLGPLG